MKNNMRPDSKKYDVFFALLRNALWGTGYPAEVFDGTDGDVWRDIFSEAHRQTVTGLVFDAMLNLPSGHMPPREIRMKMLAYVDRIESNNGRIRNVLAEITGILRANDIDFVVLKGVSVAEAYPVPMHRMEGDIDLYILGGQAARAYKLLFGEDCADAGETRHYHGHYEGVEIEIHFGLVHAAIPLYKKFEGKLLELLECGDRIYLDIEGVKVPAPGADFHALFMLEHAAFHLINGLGFRHLCDWARYLYYYRDRIDGDMFTEIIRRYGYYRIANIFLMICVRYLGMPAEGLPFSPVFTKRTVLDMRYVLKVIMRGGNFGQHYEVSLLSLKRNTMKRFWSKVTTVFIMFTTRRRYMLVNKKLFRYALFAAIKKQI